MESDRLAKVLVSSFVCLNLCTVGFINLPEAFHHWLDDGIKQQSAASQNALNTGIYYWKTYAHQVGLDNRWQMFGRQSRFNWHFHIYGLYSDGKQTKSVDLNDPRQMQRTFLQANFVDFREGKFHLNIYGERPAREAYAYYLARQQPSYQGLPIRTVVFELQHQWLRDPFKARVEGNHLDPQINVRTLDAFLMGDELPKS